MFKNLLSSIGFEDLTVDTRVGKQSYHSGETIEGLITLEGNTEHIDYIEILLVERITNDDESSDFQTFDQLLSKAHVTINSDEDVHFKLQQDKAIQSIHNQFFIMTRVYITNSVDAYDEDEIFFTES